MLTRKISYYILAICCISVGLYPFIYFVIDRKFGLLASKTDALLTDTLWNTMFYTHIILGGIALLIGWLQFNKKLRLKNLNLHRKIGKVYVISVLLSAISGFYIGLHATGGLSSKLGFTTMALFWFFSTLFAFTSIKKGNIIQHQKLMIYSYAACFAAVTLRIWLPILSNIFGGFLPAYRIVAWLSWVPNIIVAYFIIQYQFKNTN
ncbi:DUF2306 domain-containing protein [Polaribacter aquimarinus]|uniref:DUF2306 domain-containing protein n=1 Tax=Polaribacter aquimarinus TaxID=2100726 RepID=A0A2U2JDP1_9FLAO|nr:DUF2306 domain-containing protein [Polaribacter aquimarinus]PWG06458.1 hypothetical protein DIS07_01100 [Polaribacter aquimarinus]